MKAEPEKLIDLMFDNKRQYQIPVYQRNYDWKKDNCLELFNDVIAAYKNEKTHFLGTVVQVQQDEDGGIKRFIIIDGQQRMTSIYLLLKALYDLCENQTTKEDLCGLLFNTSKSKEFDKDERNKLKLKPIKSDNEQFLLLMSDRIDSMDKSSNIYLNYMYFLDLIKESLKEEIEIKNIKKGLEYLEIVMISLKEPEDDPQVIFERINSTGEDLTLADLMRNYLLMTDLNMEELYEDFWLPIEVRVGRDYLNDYFSTYLLFALPESNEKNAYQQFKKYAANKSHKDILFSLNKYSKYYNVFIRKDKSYSEIINYYLAGYRYLKQSTIFPFFFSIFSDYDEKLIDEETLCSVLRLFLNYTMRRIICEIPSNSLRGLYKTLYRRIFNDESKKNDYLNSIYDFMANIPSSKDVVPSDTRLKEDFMSKNLYKNNSACKFILGILENGFANMKETVAIDSSISIEHIMPQNKNNIEWHKEIGENFDMIYERYINTIGNLTLTGFNSELSDKKFTDKIEILKENGKFNYLNSDVIDKLNWSEETITSRASRLSDKFITELKLPENFVEKKKVNITDSHNLSENIDYSFTFPSCFTFRGEQYDDVSNYIDVLVKVLKNIYDFDAEEISELARNNATLPNGRNPYITYDRDKLRKNREIGNSGIYVETNLSSNDVIKLIRVIFEQLQIDFGDFTITIRTKKEE